MEDEYIGWNNRCAHGENDREGWIICKLQTHGEPIMCGYSDVSEGKIQEDCHKSKKRGIVGGKRWHIMN